MQVPGSESEDSSSFCIFKVLHSNNCCWGKKRVVFRVGVGEIAAEDYLNLFEGVETFKIEAELKSSYRYDILEGSLIICEYTMILR